MCLFRFRGDAQPGQRAGSVPYPTAFTRAFFMNPHEFDSHNDNKQKQGRRSVLPLWLRLLRHHAGKQ